MNAPYTCGINELTNTRVKVRRTELDAGQGPSDLHQDLCDASIL